MTKREIIMGLSLLIMLILFIIGVQYIYATPPESTEQTVNSTSSKTSPIKSYSRGVSAESDVQGSSPDIMGHIEKGFEHLAL
jgi:hypothetical protein